MLLLETIPTEMLRSEAFRCARQQRIEDEHLRAQGMDVAHSDLGAWLRQNGLIDTPRSLCSQTFRRKLQRQKKLPSSRFSDNSFPVLYSSLESQTAEAELKYRTINLQPWGRPKKPRTFYYSKFKFDFRGTVKDLRDQQASCPELTSDDYAYCNKIGALAVHLGLSGLLVPSARRRGGTNLPIFELQAISDHRESDLLAVTYHPDTGEVVLREA